MKTKKLLKTSLIVSIIGLFLLIFLVENYFLYNLSVIELNQNPATYLDKKVLVSGFLFKEKCYNAQYNFDCYFKIFDNLEENSSSLELRGTFFQEDYNLLEKNFKKNNTFPVKIEGIFKEYNNKPYLEILKINYNDN